MALALPGCSTLGRGYVDTVRTLLKPPPDVALTNDQIRQRPYSSIYLRFGANPRAVATLALIENGQEKWVTADRNMLVTQNGRLMATQGFNIGPRYTGNLRADPLRRQLTEISAQTRWIRTMDWVVDAQELSNYQVTSTYSVYPNMPITIAGTARTLTKVIEHSQIPALNVNFDNEFWFDPATNKLWYSRQYAAPGLSPVEITALN